MNPLRLDIVLASFVFLVLCTSILLGHSWLELWSQVRNWWYNDWPAFGWRYDPPAFGSTPVVGEAGVTYHTHFLRRMVTYPFFWAGLHTGIDPHSLYTGALPFMAGGTVLFATLSIQHLTNRSLSKLSALLTLPLGLVFLEMHGRMPVAFLGYSAMLWAIMRPVSSVSLVPLGVAIAGIFLTGVSSGTLLTALAVYVALAGYRLIRDRDSGPLIASGIIAIGFSYPAYSSIVKALDYYGGGLKGLVGVTRHGLGRLFISENTSVPTVVLIFMAALAALVLLLFVLRRLAYPLPVLAFLITMGFGTFGLSIAVLSIIPLTIALAAFLDNRFRSKDVWHD